MGDNFYNLLYTEKAKPIVPKPIDETEKQQTEAFSWKEEEPVKAPEPEKPIESPRPSKPDTEAIKQNSIEWAKHHSGSKETNKIHVTSSDPWYKQCKEFTNLLNKQLKQIKRRIEEANKQQQSQGEIIERASKLIKTADLPDKLKRMFEADLDKFANEAKEEVNVFKEEANMLFENLKDCLN